MIPTLPHNLADWLTNLLSGHACAPDRIIVSGGPPAAPEGEDCKQVAIWIERLFNANSDTSLSTKDCHIRTVADLRVRLDVCYPVPENGDPTEEDYATGADCLHQLMTDIWCALIPDIRTAFGMRDCAQVNLDQWQTSTPSGGMMSATLSVQVKADCAEVIEVS